MTGTNQYIAIVYDEMIQEPLIFIIVAKNIPAVTDKVHTFYASQSWNIADIVKIETRVILPSNDTYYVGTPSTVHGNKWMREPTQKAYQQRYYQEVTKEKRKRIKKDDAVS